MSTSNYEPPTRRPRKKVKRWQKILFYWRFPLVIVLLLMILSAVVVQVIAGKLSAPAATETDKKQDKPAETETLTYQDAVIDALQAEEAEMHDLICLTKEDGGVTYDNETDRVLLVFWTKRPDMFVKDEQVTLDADTYAYSDLELAAWGKENSDALKNQQTARLCQLFGMPEGSEGSAFVVAWVTPERILRAAYQPDAQIGKMTLAFEESVDQDFISFFEDEIQNNYFTNPRPWTRLGYTYDWGKTGDDHYGLTEFVIPSGVKVTVKDTFTNEEAITRLRKGTLE